MLKALMASLFKRYLGVLDDHVVLVTVAEILVENHLAADQHGVADLDGDFGVTVRSLVCALASPLPSRTCSQFLPMICALNLTTLPRRVTSLPERLGFPGEQLADGHAAIGSCYSTYVDLGGVEEIAVGG